MVRRAQWQPGHINAEFARVFQSLLVGIVMELAQRLPVLSIPEQPAVASVRNLVVNDGCGLQAPFGHAHGAKWVL